MKSRRKKIVIAIVGILLAALILNAFYTWGVVFEHNGGFERSGSYIFNDIFTEKQFGRIRLGQNLNDPIFYIPLVLCVYGIESPPYVMLLEISDETKSLEMIFVESITIEYVDGQKINHNAINWERKFEKTSILKSVNSENVRVPVNRFVDKFPIFVDKRQNCKIRFVGYFIDIKGDKIPFDTKKDFEYEAHKWRVYPLRGSF